MDDYDEILDFKPHSRTRGRVVSEQRYQKLIALETEVERLKKENRRLLLQKMAREGQELGLYDEPTNG